VKHGRVRYLPERLPAVALWRRLAAHGSHECL